MSSQSASDGSAVLPPLSLRPNQKLVRSVCIARLGLAAVLVVLAVLDSDPVGSALASFAAFMFGVMALPILRRGTPYIVATQAGIESNYFGLLRWDEIAALHIRESRRSGRALEIYDLDRKTMIRRARPRLLQVWMFLAQLFHLPLLRITERMASFDAVQFRSQLERLADRSFPER